MESQVLEEIKAAQQGDKKSKEQLVLKNSGLIWSIVKRFLNRGYEADDLYQTGCIGLIKAIDRFDMVYEVEFSTYAVPMIMGEIKRFLRDDGIIKVSRSIKELGIKSRMARESLTKALGREPTIKEIAEKIGAEPCEIAMALDAINSPESLSERKNGDERDLIDKIADNSQTEEQIVDKIAIQNALNKFDARERQIIILRYFSNKTQSEIAKMLNISQVQVSRIEKKTLKEMKKYIN